MDNNYNKIISFVISISIYILIILIIILYLKKADIKKYNFKKNEIVVEIDLLNINLDDKKSLIKEKLKPKKEKVKIKKSKSIDTKVKSNLKSLFANVKMDALKNTKKDILNVKENKTTSRFKSKYTSKEKVKDIKVSKLNSVNKKKLITENNTSNKDNIDEYYSEIKSLILKRWYENPLFNTDPYLIKVYVTINNKGEFNFNIIKYSGNIQIDNLLTKFLKEQRDIIYPVAKDNKDKTILINFKSEN